MSSLPTNSDSNENTSTQIELNKKYSPKKIRYQLNIQFGPLARFTMHSNYYTLAMCGAVALFSSLFGGFEPLVWGFGVSLPAGFWCFILIAVYKLWYTLGRFTFVEMDKQKKLDEVLDPNQWPKLLQNIATSLHSYLFQAIATFILSLPLFASPLTALAGFCMWISVFFYLIAFARYEKPARITGIYNPNDLY